MVAGRGLMPCDVGAVHTPCDAVIESDLGGIVVFGFMVRAEVG